MLLLLLLLLLLLWWHHCASVIVLSSCQEYKRIEQAVDDYVGLQCGAALERIDDIAVAMSIISIQPRYIMRIYYLLVAVKMDGCSCKRMDLVASWTSIDVTDTCIADH